jgi:hypothetical protein
MDKFRIIDPDSHIEKVSGSGSTRSGVAIAAVVLDVQFTKHQRR